MDEKQAFQDIQMAYIPTLRHFEDIKGALFSHLLLSTFLLATKTIKISPVTAVQCNPMEQASGSK